MGAQKNYSESGRELPDYTGTEGIFEKIPAETGVYGLEIKKYKTPE